MDLSALLILLLILLILSGIFSGSEAGYFSISPWRLQRLASEKNKVAVFALKRLDRPEKLLIIILLGNETVNAAISQIGAVINRNVNTGQKFWLTLIFSLSAACLLMVIGEITPKGIALRHPFRFIRFTKPVMNIWWHLFSIEVTPIEKLVKKIVSKNEASVDTIKSGSRAGRQLTRLIVLSAAEGVISRQEEVMLLRIVELDHLSTRDVMTPRHKISAIEANKTVTDVFRLMAKTGHSRLPVYKNEIDEIIGIVDLKNLMEYLKSGHTYKRRIKDLCRPAFYVPEQINLRNLLSQMQSRQEPLALVFDEYGGIKGLVTLEDIIEEVVGDIRDIEDGSEDRIREIEKGIYIVSGQALLRDLMREIHFPVNEEFAALQGYLMHLFGRMPREGEIAEDRHFMYEIKSIRGQKIVKVQITSLKRSSQKKQDEL